ncbi:hypothetical protein [Methanospirillum lacunae]|uniref:Uncharacterized protein n=1 Tax=Methanospirillum lacunae TaxID=668570 RepID=A0A2V2MV91_9EURY|nr:hypothetical protein [Methanospirillum lacunae]PWR71289.1 hypothetical protein DK846_10495 [Methanospirillum lacunae]
MRIVSVSILIIILLCLVLIAGCTALVGVNELNTSHNQTVNSSHSEGNTSAKEAVSTIKPVETQKKTVSRSTTLDANAGETYYNIRIVPASELEKLEKEMGSDEYLVKNDKDYVLGIVSSKGLTLRGDLMQIESQNVSVGKDFDKEDVVLHLLDIAFGLDNAKLKLFKSNKKYQFWLDGYYTQSEVDYVKSLATLFNSISGTTEFEDEDVALGFLNSNYAEIPYNYYNIKIFTEKMLQQYYDDKKKDSDHLLKNQKGELIGIVNDDYVYLLNTLSEEDQRYYILKGLLYSMGLHGTSYKNKESFFYRTEGLNRNLTDLDKEAIKILYGGGLKAGDSLETTRKMFGLST